MSEDATRASATRWLLGAGVMCDAVRDFDWSTTPLGPISTWALSLRTMAGVVLNSHQPMLLCWGPELIQIYNDAYLPSLGAGKYVGALGQRAREGGPGIWHIIGPHIETVMLRGEASWQKDALVQLFRNESIENAYWAYGCSPVFDDENEVVGVLVVCTETTERAASSVHAHDAGQLADLERERLLLAEAQLERKRAEDASRAKDDFLATASHELRTPLHAILGWARLLRAGTLDAATSQRGLATIERNAGAQVRLIEDILDGSRIIAGKLRLEMRSVDLSGLVRGALETVRLAAHAKGIELKVELYPERALVMGDTERLEQVVWNLCNNAIKFTQTGGVVTVVLTRSVAHFELSVADNGVGIELDFLSHVFDRFNQGSGATTRRHGGLGLGLALVRHLVEAHGGKVRAESPGPGRGATFHVSLPVQNSVTEASRPANSPPLPPHLDLRGVHALVVDDESDARELLATVLRGSRAQVTLATSAREAFEILKGIRPTILISDVAMPETDGYQLIHRVRTELGITPAQLPAIALTAHARAEDRERAVAAGFQAHVVKPVEPFDLLRIIADMFSSV